MRLMTARCHSWLPWHMLRRATFMPLLARLASTSDEQEAGPMVQINFVRRVLRKPGGASTRLCRVHECPPVGSIPGSADQQEKQFK